MLWFLFFSGFLFSLTGAKFLEVKDKNVSCEIERQRDDIFCNYGSRQYCLCNHVTSVFKYMPGTCEHVELPFPQYRANVKIIVFIKDNKNITHSQLEERLRKKMNEYAGIPLQQWDGMFHVTFTRKKCNKFLKNTLDVYLSVFEPRDLAGNVLNISTLFSKFINKDDNGLVVTSVRKVEESSVPRVFAIRHFAPMKITEEDIEQLNSQEKPNNTRNLLLFLIKSYILEGALVLFGIFMNGYFVYRLVQYFKHDRIRFAQTTEPGIFIITKRRNDF